MKPLLAKWHKLSIETRLYHRPYPVVGLTGGIASGKSSVAEFFKSKGVPVISADQLIKDIYSWPETVAWLQKLKPEVVQASAIDFTQLRKLVFNDPALKATVEQYLYALLPQAFSNAEKKFPLIPWLVYEIPLMYERQMEKYFDVSIVSWVRRDIQRERLLKRDVTATMETAEAILNAQMSLDEKRSKADVVFDNTAPLTTKALEALWSQLVG